MSRAGSSGGLEGAEPPQPSRERPLTVGQLLAVARRALDVTVRWAWVVGEVDALKTHGGHHYFQLRDERAVVGAVMWASDARGLKFAMKNGQALVCKGYFDVYEPQGRFQFIVRAAEPAGLGAEALAREQLRQRLAAEGLFETARKRELPTLPRSVGVVTSRSGAAVRDVIHAIQRRFPVPIVVADARVQGATAPASIVRALEMIGRAGVDVVILGRGGGAATDLAAFDDEAVVRAVASCPVPIISAVGHEVDVSLSDLAADVRAATPTMAGEMAVPVWSDLYDRLTGIERRLGRELGHALRGARQRLAELGERGERRVEGALAARHRALVDVRRRLAAAHPRARLLGDRRAVDAAAARLARAGALALDRRRRALDGLGRRLAAASPASSLERRRAGIAALDARAARALHRGLDERRRRFAAGIARLDALSPLAVLERGYAIATRGGHVVGDAGALAVGDELTIRLARGEVDARVERTRSGRG